MKNHLVVCFLILIPLYGTFAQKPYDKTLVELDSIIQKRSTFTVEKQQHIQYLKNLLTEEDIEGKTRVYQKLYSEYKSFIYDSAFVYAQLLLQTACLQQHPAQINESKLKLSFLLLSSGLLHECLDTLQSIRIEELPDSLQKEYYSQIARAYYDLSDYSQDKYFSPAYHNLGNQYLKKAVLLCKPNTWEYYYFQGWYAMRVHNIQAAIDYYEYLLKSYKLSLNQYAIAASSLSTAYKNLHQSDNAIKWMAQATIADIKASNHETVAARVLAELIYQQGESLRAYQYVKIALEDAGVYGARHRKLQISDILPIIEGNQLVQTETQNKALQQYSIVLTVLAVLVVLFAFIIFKQNRSLRQAKSSLAASNEYLTEANYRMQEANKIKEEYIGHFFTTFSEYIDKIDAFKKAITRKITSRRIEEIGDIVQKINLKTERENLFYSFDTTFLRIFPNFIVDFNTLFKEEDHYSLHEKQELPVELRIFALIRLGIKDNEKIAKILDYSINTIYTYKTKVKNKSIIPNEHFEDELLKIKTG
ncbi:DUF6377 domain-containing protein [Xanthocytophaga agilis]|uniref:DUF6377 domain-containing protein n=1 Tax=Xanthocytophaga agilis TaxID=3048010 RepID=A0AAE3UDJ5_9BACT|nr:DUF6377 domain-containing protein [Xanthocytophaga agilis]MDJ1501913.1 DUF6377 domain-containing protein [Xanthocytophaga agilis]